MPFKMKGFPMIGGTKPMKMAVKSAKKMKAEKAMKLKEEAAMKNKGLENLAAANPELTYTPKQLKEAAMKLKEEKAPMKEKEKSGKMTK